MTKACSRSDTVKMLTNNQWSVVRNDFPRQNLWSRVSTIIGRQLIAIYKNSINWWSSVINEALGKSGFCHWEKVSSKKIYFEDFALSPCSCWWSFLPPCQLVKILVNCLRLQFHQLSRFDEDANAIGSQSAQVSVIGGDVGGECNPCLSPPTTTTPLLHRPHHLKIDSLRLILSGLPIASLKAILSRGGVVPAPAYYGFPRWVTPTTAVCHQHCKLLEKVKRKARGGRVRSSIVRHCCSTVFPA